jgi:hypothetical protein
VADAVLVRTVADPEIVELNGSGVLLWTALIEPLTPGELARELSVVADAPFDVVARDVRTALTDLVRRGLVTKLGVM